MLSARIKLLLLKSILCGLPIFLGMSLLPSICSGQTSPGRAYAGSESCKSCHEKEYNSFVKYSKKSHSFNSLMKMKKNLTEEELKQCFECHTTGYGKAGGFRSEKETPHMKDAGCEVCHGPGSIHVKTGDPKDIKSHLTSKDCETCHNQDRVATFNYKPLVYGGAH